MNDDDLEQLERRLAAAVSPTSTMAPRQHRAAVLSAVQRELSASRWDRRLTRVAAAVVAVGVGLNVLTGLPAGHEASDAVARAERLAPPDFIQTAVAVAEATDGPTGRQYARQLALLSGVRLTVEQTAAIDAAVAASLQPN